MMAVTKWAVKCATRFGFAHDADGDGTNDISGTATSLTTGSGPTEGKLATTDNDGLSVSFEFSEDETVVGSALIRWNIGEVQWLEASYPASGTGVIRVIDADMNLDPEAIDNFDVDAWSDSDAGGIDLTVTETNELQHSVLRWHLPISAPTGRGGSSAPVTALASIWRVAFIKVYLHLPTWSFLHTTTSVIPVS
jgi:hypothetical protein